MSDKIEDQKKILDTDKTPCPAPVVMGMIGGKWKLLILQILIFSGTKRFGELLKLIDGITQTMLTKQLRTLETDKLISRQVFPEVPPRVEYSVTEDGLALRPVFEAMHEWWLHRTITANDG